MKLLGLIAGNGKFPLMVAHEAKREGMKVIAVALHGETPQEIESVADQVTWIYVGQLGRLIGTLQRAGVAEAIMAGGIRKVRLFDNFRPDLRGVLALARAKSREDDAMLRAVAQELENEGIKVVASTLCLPHLVPQPGLLTSHEPNATQWEDIRLGFRVAKEVGRLGIGQTVVVKGGIFVAVEAADGTDAAIRRGGELAKAGCVVVKVSKPQQDLRFDVPAVGVETVNNLHAVRGAVLAIEAGKTILLEREALLRNAEAYGLAVVAVAAEQIDTNVS